MMFQRLHIRIIFLIVLGGLIVQLAGLNCVFAKDEPLSGKDLRIIVKENSFVKSSHIFLGDISDIYADGILKEALGKIELGSSPKPGEIKSFEKTKIISIVRSQRYLPENITVISPQRVYIKRMSQTISKQDIRQIIDENLARTFENREYELKKISVRGLGTYPRGETELRLDSNEIVDEKGKISVFLDVMIDGKKEDRVSVSGVVALYDTVLHAAKSCKKGVILTREIVYLGKKNIFELKDNFIRTFEEIDGKSFRSGVRKGDVLKSSLLTESPLIQKGDIVQLVSKNENLRIVTSAISKEDGFENKMIKVENLSSGKLVRGIVTGRSKVEVLY